MTDKQIIIDGIDVGGCIYYEDGKCLNGEMVQCNCKNVAVCYYKEYKRKEQECEGLKEAQKNSRCAWKSFEGTFCPEAQEQLEAYKMEADEGKEINAELKAENDELKRLIAKQKNAKIQLSKLKDKQYKEFCDMKQTLTEIKEIIRNQGHIDILEEQILQKISECEGNDGN